MSVLIEEIGSFLVANGYGTLGTNIFLGYQPSGPDECITVLDRGGYTTDTFVTVIGDATRKYDQIGAQILLRGLNYKSLMEKAYQIYDLFHRQVNYILGSFLVSESHAESLPIPLGRDENGRDEISINFIFSVFRQ